MSLEADLGIRTQLRRSAINFFGGSSNYKDHFDFVQNKKIRGIPVVPPVDTLQYEYYEFDQEKKAFKSHEGLETADGTDPPPQVNFKMTLHKDSIVPYRLKTDKISLYDLKTARKKTIRLLISNQSALQNNFDVDFWIAINTIITTGANWDSTQAAGVKWDVSATANCLFDIKKLVEKITLESYNKGKVNTMILSDIAFNNMMLTDNVNNKELNTLTGIQQAIDNIIICNAVKDIANENQTAIPARVMGSDKVWIGHLNYDAPFVENPSAFYVIPYNGEGAIDKYGYKSTVITGDPFEDASRGKIVMLEQYSNVKKISSAMGGIITGCS